MAFTLLLAAPLLLQGSGRGPLPPPPVPAENPLTQQKAILGKALFWDEQLSSDDTVACGTCHRPEAGFTDPREAVHPGVDLIRGTVDDRLTSPGIVRSDDQHRFKPDPVFGLEVQATRRRSPDLFTAIYGPEAFWDGRASGEFRDPLTGAVVIPVGGALESQVVGPPVSDAEMAHESRDWSEITTKLAQVRPLALASDLTPDLNAALRAHPDYPALFANAFGTPEITPVRIAFAIASYERTLVPERAPYFRWLAGQSNAMTPDQIEGHDQFFGAANCAVCHQPPVFTVWEYSNLGLRPWQEDSGRMEVTGLMEDRGKFKTPGLLGAGLRPRYFHTGETDTLWPGGVGQLYLDGGGPETDNRDPILTPLSGVPGVDMSKVMDFVGNALTDPRMADRRPPFDRPTLRSERMPPGANRIGPGTPALPGEEAPRLLADQPAYPGATLFRIGVDGGPAGAGARLLIGEKRIAGKPARGVEVHVRPDPAKLIPLQLEDDSQGGGFATVFLPIPDHPGLVGTQVFVQCFIEDPRAPFAATASEAVAVRIEG